MNKKIFTLFVGALLLLGSAFTTVSAQTLPYKSKPQHIYDDAQPGASASTYGSGKADFYDILRADTVKRMPVDYKGHYYLLSVTGIANANNTPAPTVNFSKPSLEDSWVMFVDENGDLRVDLLSKIDSAYNFVYSGSASDKSYKFGALRQASWCLDVNKTSGVYGSNVTFDFMNMNDGKALEVPLYEDTKANWVNDTYSQCNAAVPSYIYNKTVNLNDDNNIVSGWHFSQSFTPDQNLQYGMPLYSYVPGNDYVNVFILRDSVYGDVNADNWAGTNAGRMHKEGGYRVSIAKVSVHDLIRDTQGNVRLISGGGNYIGNVLLFTLKRVAPFVMNADDWNAVQAVSNENDKGILFDVAGKVYKNGDFEKHMNTGVQNPLKGVKALEVNDSLYHYGYMNFTKGALDKFTDNNWLYVDTGKWANSGNTEYLTFNWSARRDSTSASNWTGEFEDSPTNTVPKANAGMSWGDSFIPSVSGVDNYGYNSMKPDFNAYAIKVIGTPRTTAPLGDKEVPMWYGYTPAGSYTLTDAIYSADSILAIIASNATKADPGIDSLLGIVITTPLSATDAAKLAIVTVPPTTGTGMGSVGTAAISWTAAAAGDSIYFVWREDKTAKYVAAVDAYKKDSINFMYAYKKDSIMENQSKFRVVYDPYADSTWINVYQSRKAYPDFSKGANDATWPNWWENSFRLTGIGGVFEVPSFTINDPQTQADKEAYDNTMHGTGATPGSSDAGFYKHGVAGSSPDAHSYRYFWPSSTLSNMDKVMISTADTAVLYDRYYAAVLYPTPEYTGLSHIYGASKNSKGEYKYQDSLFYIDVQNLTNNKKIITLDQSIDNQTGIQGLNTQIMMTFGAKCKEDESQKKATIGSDLYLIRNSLGQYLCVPLWSVSDSVYWITPEENEDPTKMPCYQWAVSNIREGIGSSPFKMANREFRHVAFDYVYLYDKSTNKQGTFQIGNAHAYASFLRQKPESIVYAGVTESSIGTTHPDVKAETFVTDMKQKFPMSEEASFIKLDASVKGGDQTLGYKYIDDDSTYVDVYAFKYLHFMASGNKSRYIGWNGYKKDMANDTCLYVNYDDPYDKLFFDLQRLSPDELLDSQSGDYLRIKGDDTNSPYYNLYTNYTKGDHHYVNSDSIVMEKFGLNPDADKEYFDKIAGLRPLARQAYRLLLKDYYKWHPTLKGDYVTVGEQDRYILADRAYASKKYVQQSGRVEGLFGIPHFYFRNTYFDVDSLGDDYFALVQRLDTTRADISSTQYEYGYGATNMNDLSEYLTSTFGSNAAHRVLEAVRLNREKSVAVAVVEDYTARLKFAMRGDAAIRVSTFQLEQDDDPIYRRFHVNEPEDKEFFPEMGDTPDTLEFHWLNDGETGYRLYENSGNYYGVEEPVSDRFGEAGGRVYNIDKNNNFLRDSLNNVISFLGVNNSAQYGSVTNYAFFVDTAYIKGGTGWIKPQYMLAVDPWKGNEEGACDPVTGENTVGVNDNYKLARYLFNASQYAKEVRDSVILDDDNRTVVWADKTYGKDKLDTKEDAAYIKDNFNKVEPIQDGVVRKKPTFDWDGTIYTDANTKWERLAFSWAIHKGDTLFVLKGFEPAFGGANGDPDRVWQKLTELYGNPGKNIDFNKLMDYCYAKDAKGNDITYKEAYYPYGNTRSAGEVRTYHKFKDVPFKMDGKEYNYGLQAIVLLNDNTHKDWVFSMRYVERNSSDFVIESETTDRDTRYGAMIRPGYGGWIKYQNGIPTITRSDEKNLMGEAAGSVFNVKQLTNPVANEVVEGEAVVSNVKVIGGTGNVTILNATGKKVVVSNILGQTVANTVLSSDNASIAVPAGIVVVAVEGETAVKALVK